MLLYAQPASRIVRLTLDDIVHDANGQVFIRLGEPPTPVPAARTATASNCQDLWMKIIAASLTG